jgi:hypothetical protein
MMIQCRPWHSQISPQEGPNLTNRFQRFLGQRLVGLRQEDEEEEWRPQVWLQRLPWKKTKTMRSSFQLWAASRHRFPVRARCFIPLYPISWSGLQGTGTGIAYVEKGPLIYFFLQSWRLNSGPPIDPHLQSFCFYR